MKGSSGNESSARAFTGTHKAKSLTLKAPQKKQEDEKKIRWRGKVRNGVTKCGEKRAEVLGTGEGGKEEGAAKRHSCPSKEQMSLFFVSPHAALAASTWERRGRRGEAGRRNVKRIRTDEHRCMAPSFSQKSSFARILENLDVQFNFLKSEGKKEATGDENIEFIIIWCSSGIKRSRKTTNQHHHEMLRNILTCEMQTKRKQTLCLKQKWEYFLNQVRVMNRHSEASGRRVHERTNTRAWTQGFIENQGKLVRWSSCLTSWR